MTALEFLGWCALFLLVALALVIWAVGDGNYGLKAGAAYLMRSSNPFAKEVKVQVVDVKEGYVQYRFFLRDNSLSEAFVENAEAFARVFREIPDPRADTPQST